MIGYRGRYDYPEAIFGEIYVKDNTDPTILNSASKVKIIDFDSEGLSHKVTLDLAFSCLIVQKKGIYMVSICMHLNNNAAQTHVVDISLYTNGAETAILNVHGHRTLTGGSGDVGSLAAYGVVAFDVDDTVKVYADTDSSNDRSVTFEDVTLNIYKIDY